MTNANLNFTTTITIEPTFCYTSILSDKSTLPQQQLTKWYYNKRTLYHNTEKENVRQNKGILSFPLYCYRYCNCGKVEGQ